MVLEGMIDGFSTVFSGVTFLYLVIGCLLGLFFGVLPGLGGSVALALLIPVTIGMEPEQAVVLLAAVLGSVVTGGSITAILLNTPGTANNAATCLDGYPMAQRGRAGEAIGAGATSCALGAIFGMVLLAMLVPSMRAVVLAFGPPEVFMVAVFGLTLIATVSIGSMISGLLAGAFGLALSMFGQSPVSMGPRFDFGQVYLWDGIQLVPALIGFYAIAEMINLAVSSKTVAQGGSIRTTGVGYGVLQALRRPWLILRSSAIGFGIGLVPGVGGTVAAFVAYSATKQSAKDPDSFGRGDVRGVIASESANDATDGGSLMPTLALGIPGSPSTAVLLAGLIFHGIFPGQELLTTNVHIIFTLVGAMIMSNILASLINISASTTLAKLTLINPRVLVPVVLVITVMGAFGVRNTFGDVMIALLFGIVGYVMLRFGYSRVPTVIGLILGVVIERSYNTSIQISGGSHAIFFNRPLTVLFLVLTVLTLMLPLWQYQRTRKRSEGVPEDEKVSET